MKAMLLPQYGPPESFSYGDAPMPQAGADDLLVKVRGSSVNPIDCHLRNGDMRAWVRLKLPAILGVELAGDVTAIGADVTRFRPGDRVYAYVGPQHVGGYGEYARVPAAMAAKVPRNLKTHEAGVVPGVGLTAYEAFVQHAPVEARMRVLINGAAGGVGTFAIQIAKARGARVTGVCRASKASYVRRLGADAVIDYESTDVLKTEERFDVVLQAARTHQLGGLRGLLTPKGRIVTITAGPLTMAASKVRNAVSSRKTISFFVKTDGKNLEGLSRMIEAGQVKPYVDQTFGWRELAAAHRRVESGETRGKVAVKIED